MNALCWTLIILSVGLLLLTSILVSIYCWQASKKNKKNKDSKKIKKQLKQRIIPSNLPTWVNPVRFRPKPQHHFPKKQNEQLPLPPETWVYQRLVPEIEAADPEIEAAEAGAVRPYIGETAHVPPNISSPFDDLFNQQVETINCASTEPEPEDKLKAVVTTTVTAPTPPVLSFRNPLIPLPLKKICVITYNVRVDVDKQPHNWDSRKMHVLENIRQYAPSIICLQESTEKVKRFFEGALPNFGIISCRRALNSEEAVPILYNKNHWKKIFSQTYLLTNKGPKPCASFSCRGTTVFGGKKARHPRILTCVKLRNPGSNFEVLVLNTHFPLDYDIQLGCARQISNLISTKYKNLPVILCGDFNSHYAPTDEASPLQQLVGRTLKDSHDLVDTPTFGSFSALAPKSHRLDYILFNNLEKVDVGISDHTYGPGFRPSDHSLLYAVFKTSTLY
jgi:endonuclease/exonuclease/phosphatase family metal-dependent hydrolase